MGNKFGTIFTPLGNFFHIPRKYNNVLSNFINQQSKFLLHSILFAISTLLVHHDLSFWISLKDNYFIQPRVLLNVYLKLEAIRRRWQISSGLSWAWEVSCFAGKERESLDEKKAQSHEPTVGRAWRKQRLIEGRNSQGRRVVPFVLPVEKRPPVLCSGNARGGWTSLPVAPFFGWNKDQAEDCDAKAARGEGRTAFLTRPQDKTCGLNKHRKELDHCKKREGPSVESHNIGPHFSARGQRDTSWPNACWLLKLDKFCKNGLFWLLLSLHKILSNIDYFDY